MAGFFLIHCSLCQVGNSTLQTVNNLFVRSNLFILVCLNDQHTQLSTSFSSVHFLLFSFLGKRRKSEKGVFEKS